jgi:hypothetical protein
MQKVSKKAVKLVSSRETLIEALEACLADSDSQGQKPFELSSTGTYAFTARHRLFTNTTPNVQVMLAKHGLEKYKSMYVCITAQFTTKKKRKEDKPEKQKVVQQKLAFSKPAKVTELQPQLNVTGDCHLNVTGGIVMDSTKPAAKPVKKVAHLDWVGNPGLQLLKVIAAIEFQMGFTGKSALYDVCIQQLPEMSFLFDGVRLTIDDLNRIAVKTTGRKISADILKQRADRTVRYGEWPTGGDWAKKIQVIRDLFDLKNVQLNSGK